MCIEKATDYRPPYVRMRYFLELTSNISNTVEIILSLIVDIIFLVRILNLLGKLHKKVD